MNKTKLLIMDVDGTLYDGTLGMDFLKHLTEVGLIEQKTQQEIHDWYTKYKNGSVSKQVAVDEIYKAYALGLEGKSVVEVLDVASNSWKVLKKNLFTFVAYKLNELLKKNFTPIFISGSTSDIVGLLAADFGVMPDSVIAGELEQKNGLYTGKITQNVANAQDKLDFLMSWIESRGLIVDWQNSIAFGNDERDSLLFQKVGKAFVVKPDADFMQIAQANGWTIVSSESILSQFEGLG